MRIFDDLVAVLSDVVHSHARSGTLLGSRRSTTKRGRHVHLLAPRRVCADAWLIWRIVQALIDFSYYLAIGPFDALFRVFFLH